MKTCVSLSKYLVAVLLLAPCALLAQRPDRVALSAAQPPQAAQDPLPVLDDFGVPITEKEIRRYQGSGGARWFHQPLAFIIGAAALYAAVPKGTSTENCSIYDPCSDREKFYRSTSALTGGVLGVILVNAVGPGLNRWQAIEKVRQDRRVMHREPGR